MRVCSIYHSQLILSAFAVIGMYIHTYSYQKWDKHSSLNNQWEIEILWMMFKIMAITDLFEVIVKKKSITTKETKKDILVYDFLFPVLLLFIQLYIFKDVEISGYKNTFLLVKTILMIMNSAKIILIFHRGKFVADLVKLVDTIWIINLMLIMLTDPEVNTAERKNLIIFYEVYFRYLEYHILILVFPLISNYGNIDTEIAQKLYTTSTIIGKNDTYRIFVILIFSHYYFPLVNGIAYSLK